VFYIGDNECEWGSSGISPKSFFSPRSFIISAKKVLMLTAVCLCLVVIMSRSSTARLMNLQWRKMGVKRAQLDPKMTLIMGQCFNWNKLPASGRQVQAIDLWVAIVEGRALAIKYENEATYYASLLGDEGSGSGGDDLDDYLKAYFQLDHDLEECYALWGRGCPRMKAVTSALPGVRVLRQEPWECLISFICSSNNNIKRITLMLDRLKRTYGNYVCSVVPTPGEKGGYSIVVDPNPPVIPVGPTGVDAALFASPQKTPTKKKNIASKEEGKEVIKEEPGENAAEEDVTNIVSRNDGVVHLFDFPTVERLAAASESDLRNLGMGYRAKFIKGTAEKVLSLGGTSWLNNLRVDSRPTRSIVPADEAAAPASDSKSGKKMTKKDRDAAASMAMPHRLWVNEQLQLLPGVGRKVADCVAVFSLDQAESIPVDVHVWDIAVRDYAPDLQQALSLTPAIYEQVGDLFRERFKHRAGWAHSVLFAAELPGFKQMLPLAMQQEMDIFDAEQRKLKQEKRDSAKKRKEESTGKEKEMKRVKSEDGEGVADIAATP
jgi:N-glycosylase/DNA lyase